MFAIAMYFLVAAFVPRLRMRWGITIGIKTTTLKPHLGMVSCIGMSVFTGAFAVLMTWNIKISPESILHLFVGAFVTICVGAVIDWFNEPTIHRKR
jgi:hypothetical protein